MSLVAPKRLVAVSPGGVSDQDSKFMVKGEGLEVTSGRHLGHSLLFDLQNLQALQFPLSGGFESLGSRASGFGFRSSGLPGLGFGGFQGFRVRVSEGFRDNLQSRSNLFGRGAVVFGPVSMRFGVSGLGFRV